VVQISNKTRIVAREVGTRGRLVRMSGRRLLLDLVFLDFGPECVAVNA
jgi:hypothetical protein